MKAYLVDGKGIDAVVLSERAALKIKNDCDILVDVKACSLNYRDLMVAKGTYAPGPYPPFIALSDMSGIVRAIGDKVTEFKVGDRVLNSPFRHWPAGRLQAAWAKTFVGGAGIDGVLAEQIIYPADALVKLPDYLSYEEGATFTIAGLTAWAAVVTHGKVLPGEWVLLHGTGGVSIFAAQIAHLMGAKTVMTTSSPEKGNYVKKHFGVTETVNYKDADWSKKVKEITGDQGVDIVVDVVGGETLSQSLHISNFGARVASIGVLAGQELHIRTRDLLSHQVQIRGTFMESTQELKALMRAAETAKLKPAVDKVFAFSQVQEAYKHVEAQKHVGKVVITVA